MGKAKEPDNYKQAAIRYIQEHADIFTEVSAKIWGNPELSLKEYYAADLYCKVLAVKNDSKDIISTLNLTSKIPLIMRKSDTLRLKKTAQKSFEKDVLANELYNLAMGEKSNENQTIFV